MVPKYECHIKLKTKKDGPVIRSQMRLPHSVKTDIKICVICPPDSPAAQQAREAGAVLVGEEVVFEVIKSGKFDFDRCIAQPSSLPKMNQAGLGRILGPRGLMPSTKLGTVVDNVGTAIKNMLGGSMYRERQGVVRMAVGQLGFTPEQLRDNVKSFVGQIKKDATNLSDQVTKEVYEVVSCVHPTNISRILTKSSGFELYQFARFHIKWRVPDRCIANCGRAVRLSRWSESSSNAMAFLHAE